jgi:hypothetical protein
MAKPEKNSKDKDSKSKKELTPLEKARLARAKGGTKKKAKKKKIEFKAPEGEKPFFLRVGIAFDRDGLITDMSATRVKGNPDNENSKSVSLADWDPNTLRRLATRYAGPAFIRNEQKRLGAKAQAQLLVRVAINRETRFIKVSLKTAKFKVEDKKAKTLEKKDPVYRALRKPMAFLAPAFTKVRPFPSATELKAIAKAKTDES